MANSCRLAEQLLFTRLAQSPGWLEPLAHILSQQRVLEGHPLPLPTLIHRLQAEIVGPSAVSTTLALHPEGYIAGCVSLGPLHERPGAGLWLSNLWVAPALRRQGLGRHLCQRQVRRARRQGADCLQLYTQDHEAFYAALGWQPARRAIIGGRPCTVMSLPLGDQPA